MCLECFVVVYHNHYLRFFTKNSSKAFWKKNSSLAHTIFSQSYLSLFLMNSTQSTVPMRLTVALRQHSLVSYLDWREIGYVLYLYSGRVADFSDFLVVCCAAPFQPRIDRSDQRARKQKDTQTRKRDYSTAIYRPRHVVYCMYDPSSQPLPPNQTQVLLTLLTQPKLPSPRYFQ